MICIGMMMMMMMMMMLMLYTGYTYSTAPEVYRKQRHFVQG